MYSAENMNYGISIMTKEIIKQINITQPSAPPTQDPRFYEELELAVTKHLRYLKETEWMKKVYLPKSYLFVKRAMDLVVGIMGLILLSPVFLVVAILIKLDSKGPVIFIQERVGKNGKLFKIYKFRTMIEDAEANTGAVWATEDDPRLTFVGKKLRDSKIDEFPQLVNLIKGDMSMVGPRPERPTLVCDFARRIPGYCRRFDIIPGITGLAQLKNGYDKDAAKLLRKLRFEVTYIKKMNLSMDLKLIFDTVIAALKGKF